MTKFKKQNVLRCKFQKKKKKKKKKIREPLFHCRENSVHKNWWSGKTLSVLLKYILKPGSFSHKIVDKSCLKVGKTK